MALLTRSACRCLAALGVALLPMAGCEPASTPEPLFGNRTLKGPKKVGSSITHTKMCECQSCDPSECCGGDIGENNRSAPVCKDSYDFTKEGCGLEVSSCSARCSRHVWRVRLDQDCDKTTPLICCGA